MSSEFDFHHQLILAAVSGLVANGKCPDDDVADRAFKIVNSVIDQYPGDLDAVAKSEPWVNKQSAT